MIKEKYNPLRRFLELIHALVSYTFFPIALKYLFNLSEGTFWIIFIPHTIWVMFIFFRGAREGLKGENKW